MPVARHSEMRIQRLNLGRENAPLLVVDNLVSDPDELLELAAAKVFSEAPSYYPGMRSKAPLSYQRFILDELRPHFDEHFGLRGRNVRFTECNFSLVTTPGDKLAYLQRIPHVDSLKNDELAMIHYLFKSDLGGTAFYRHRSTGFEYVDSPRQLDYLKEVHAEKDGPNSAKSEYINGDTALYEQIGRQEGVFNRLLMYRRTTLHSASLRRDFVPDPSPRTGRLSVNGFLA